MAGIKPHNVIRIPSTIDNIFRYWLSFLAPFHHLTEREEDVAAALLKERFKLSKVVLDNELLDRMLMSEDTQAKIREECSLNNQHFQVIKSKLKQKKFLINGKINPKLIPNIKEDSNNFQLLLLFDLNEL